MNKGHHVETDHQKIARLDRSDDVQAPKTVPLLVIKAIQRARQDKGWTQKDLGNKVNEKSTVINDYENGKGK